MQTPSPLRNDNICMKDAHSAESDEKSYFRFLFFELWLILITIYGDTLCVQLTKKKSSKVAKIIEKMRINLIIIF